MYKPIVWVARPDGTGWNGTRPRDLSDYSLCIYKESPTHRSKLVVRETYSNDHKARARKIVGEFYFDTAKEAKLTVTTVLDAIDNDPLIMTQSVARDKFMLLMDRASFDDSLRPGIAGDAAFKWYKNVVGAIVSNGFTVYSSTPTEHDEPVHIGELAAEVMENAGMVESIEEIQAAVEPAFDPSTWQVGEPIPSGYISMGNKLVQLGWPS